MQLVSQPLGIGLPGSWTLPSARAVTLGAATDGFLQVAHGTVWATFDGPHPQGAANDWGDLVLRCGTRIHLMAGQQVVLERYQHASNEAVGFSWEPDVAQPARPSHAQAWLGRWWRSLWTPRRAGLQEWTYGSDTRAGESARQAAWRHLRELRINPP
jgi:hypothetical protein